MGIDLLEFLINEPVQFVSLFGRSDVFLLSHNKCNGEIEYRVFILPAYEIVVYQIDQTDASIPTLLLLYLANSVTSHCVTTILSIT